MALPAGAAQLRVHSAIGQPDTSIQIPISLASGGEAVGAVVFEVEYDLTKLEFEGRPELPAYARNGQSVQIFGHLGDGRLGIAAYDTEAPVETVEDGVLVTLQFRIRPAAAGFAAIRVGTTVAPQAAGIDGGILEASSPSTEPTGVFITTPQADVAVSPGAVNFGSLNIGETGERLVRVSNLGSATATLAAIRIEQPAGAAFGLTGMPPMPRDLPPGQSISLLTRFAGFGEGTYSALLVIEQAAPIAVRLEIPLSASVVEQGAFAYTSRMLIPAVMRREDSDGWHWRTTVAMLNPTDRTVSTLMTLLRSDATPQTREVRLTASQTRVWQDLALELFQEENASGAVIVRSSSADLVLRSTLVRERDGAYGAHSVAVIEWAELLQFEDQGYLFLLGDTQEKATTLSLLNLGDQPATVEVSVLRGSGHRLYVLGPGEMRHGIALLDEVGAGNEGTIVVRLKVLTPGGLFHAQATTADRLSGGFVLQSTH